MKYIILIFILLGIIFVNPVNALSLDSATAYPYKSFACQPIIIYANFSGGTPTEVYANINMGETIYEHQVIVSENYNLTMTNSGGGIWYANWGNNENLHWGKRNIIFNVYDSGLTTFSANNVVFIMNSGCTGTGKTNYSQMAPSSLGNFSKLIYQGKNPLELGMYYWYVSWGYMIYVLILIMICIPIYMKSQNILSPLIAAVIMLLVAAPFGIVPLEYRNWIIMILGLCLGAIYVKFFMKD